MPALPVEAPAAGRGAAEPVVPAVPAPVGAVPVEPPDPADGAMATRGVPKDPEAAGFEAGALAAALLSPKLGGRDGEDPAAPAPAGGIVGSVESPAGWNSDPPPKEDDGGGPLDGSNEPPEPT